MAHSVGTIRYRTVGEWELRSEHRYPNPYTDVAVKALFTSPSGNTFTVSGYHDGERTWRVRFNSNEGGRWTYRIFSRPADAGHLRWMPCFPRQKGQ